MSASSKKKLRKEQNAAQLTERQLQEQKEAKKLRNYTIGFVTAIIAIVCIALITIGVTAFVNSGIIERNTEAVKIGDHTLNAAQFNYYFIDEFQATYSEWQELYGDSADMYIAWEERYDITKPLNEQKHPTVEGKTYADYFAELALEKAKETYAVYDAAAAAGFELSEEEAESIDATVQNMDFWAMYMGYSNTKEYLKSIYGKGATEESFREYLTVTTIANVYENSYADSLTYEQAELDAYNNEHFNDFSSFSYSSFVLMPDNFIEHAEDGSHDHTDEETQAALVKAKETADNIVASGAATYEDLNAAILATGAYAEDKSKATQNKDILYTKISPIIGEWLVAEGRQVGDLSVVPYTSTSTDEDGNETEETVGYYVILFEGRNDNESKLVNIRHVMVEFEGGTEDADGNKVYSDDEKAAAKAEIEKLHNAWKTGTADEAAFEALSAENATHGVTIDDEGLEEDMYPGKVTESEAFNEWCFSADRKEGDCGIVETEFGYHLIYFVKATDTTYRNQMIHDKLAEAEHEEWHKNLVEAMEASLIDISKLSVDFTMS